MSYCDIALSDAIQEFRRLNEQKEAGKFHIARSEAELMKSLDAGWILVQTLNEDKYLLRM